MAGALLVVLASAPPVPLPPAPTPDPLGLEALLISPQGLSTVIGLVLPLLTGLLSSPRWPAPVRGLLLLGLSLLTSIGTELAQRLADGVAFDWRQVALAAASTWVLAQVAHTGFWRDTALSRHLQDLGAGAPVSELDDRSVSAISARLEATRPTLDPQQVAAAGRRARLAATPPYPSDPAEPPPTEPSSLGRHDWRPPQRPPP